MAAAQERHAYFGQTHQHTSWSLDAYIIGNTVTGLEEAYQYSMGQVIKHPAGYDVQIKTPLDVEGVTDHAEYMGVIRLANDPNSPISRLPIAAKLKVTKDNSAVKIFQFLAGSIASRKPISEPLDPALTDSVWKQNVAIARKYNNRPSPPPDPTRPPIDENRAALASVRIGRVYVEDHRQIGSWNPSRAGKDSGLLASALCRRQDY
jgi:hypothetical protein